jgi:hypothetical protein
MNLPCSTGCALLRFFIMSLTALCAAGGLAEQNRLPRTNLLVYHKSSGEIAPVRSVRDWAKRRQEILAGMQSVMGPLPSRNTKHALEMRIVEEVDCGKYVRRLITYSAEPGGRTPAYLLIPKSALQ